MKIKLLISIIFAIGLTGCASSFTSIEAAEEANKYYLTENYQRPFGISGTLHLCEAQGNEKLVCKSVD